MTKSLRLRLEQTNSNFNSNSDLYTNKLADSDHNIRYKKIAKIINKVKSNILFKKEASAADKKNSSAMKYLK